ncbi:MAG: hypothetical protein R2837_02335 [Aliarcobacter sp.]
MLIKKIYGGSDIATVGAIGNLDFVTLDAWYLDLNDTFDSYYNWCKI